MRVRMLLDWTLDAKHAIFTEASREGCYARRGIDLEMLEPASKSSAALQRLSRDEAELAINYPHNIMAAHPRDPGVLSIGALVKHNPEGILSLSRSGIHRPADLAGKRVGIGPSPVSQAQFDVFLSENGLRREDLEVVTVGFDGEALLLSGRIEALDAVAYANVRTLRKGHEIGFLPYARYGLPDSPFLVFAARGSWLERNPEAARGFLAATAEGFERVSRWNAEQWREYVESIPGRNPEEELEVWRSIRPLIIGNGRLFEQSIEDLNRLKEILFRKKVLVEEVPVETLFPDRFLPDAGRDTGQEAI